MTLEDRCVAYEWDNYSTDSLILMPQLMADAPTLHDLSPEKWSA